MKKPNLDENSMKQDKFLFYIYSVDQGCLWGGLPARPIRPIDLRARPIRVKWALTDHPW
jgi:hypothetical protein